MIDKAFNYLDASAEKIKKSHQKTIMHQVISIQS